MLLHDCFHLIELMWSIVRRCFVAEYQRWVGIWFMPFGRVVVALGFMRECPLHGFVWVLLLCCGCSTDLMHLGQGSADTEAAFELGRPATNAMCVKAQRVCKLELHR